MIIYSLNIQQGNCTKKGKKLYLNVTQQYQEYSSALLRHNKTN